MSRQLIGAHIHVSLRINSNDYDDIILVQSSGQEIWSCSESLVYQHKQKLHSTIEYFDHLQ